MANGEILTAEQERQLRQPIDEYVGKIQKEIDESRTGDLDFFEHRGRNRGNEFFGKVQRFFLGQTGKPHRRIRGIIPMGGVAGVLNDDLSGVDGQTDGLRGEAQRFF